MEDLLDPDAGVVDEAVEPAASGLADLPGGRGDGIGVRDVELDRDEIRAPLRPERLGVLSFS